MALSLIDVGTTANDGTGDPLRTAFQTVNTALTLLNDFAEASNADGNIVVGTGTGWAAESGATARTSLGLGTGNDVTFSSVEGVNGVKAGSLASVYNFFGFASDAQAGAPSGIGANELLITGGVNGSTVIGTLGNTSGEGLKIGTIADPTGTPVFTTNFVVESTTGDTLFYNAGATVGMAWDASTNSNAGGLGIRTDTPTGALDVNDDTIRVRTSKTPASAAAAGNAGDICWDASYIYVCTATNTWKRAAIATW
jgi:hypothetical protein